MVAVSIVAFWASAASAATDMEVSVPTRVVSGRPATFVVDLTADQATTGTIRVSFESWNYYEELVEVPGGSTKRFVITTGSLSWGGQATVTFEGSDGSNKTARVAVEESMDPSVEDAVAVFPSLTSNALPASVETVVDGRRANLHMFDPEFLRGGGDVLAPVGSILMTSADLADLDAQQLLAIESWVAGGGQMYYEGPVDKLPPEIRPDRSSGAADTWVGQGSVRPVDDGVLSGGDLDGILIPSAGRNMADGGWSGPSELTRSLADDAGVSLLDIDPIILFLLAYVVLVGPVLWFTLRSMNRLPLFWVAAPVVALLSTGAIWAFGQATKSGTDSSFASIVVDNGPTTTTNVASLLLSPSGGWVGVDLGSDWQPTPMVSDPWTVFGDTVDGQIGGRVVGAGYGRDLPAGGVAVLQTTSTAASSSPSWSVSVDSLSDQLIEGTISNNTGRLLSGVTVGIGADAQTVDEVAPGGSQPFSINRRKVNVNNERLGSTMVELTKREARNGAPVNAGLIQLWYDQARISNDSLVVVGWTDELASPTPINGDDEVRGRTGFLSVVNPQSAASADASSVLPARSRLLTKAFSGEFGTPPLVDQNGVARVVYGPAGEGHPGLAGVDTGPDDSPDTEGTETTLEEDSGVVVEDFDQADAQIVMPEGEEFIGVYAFDLYPGAEPPGQLVVVSNRLHGLDYWDGTAWAPSGLATDNAGRGPVAWALPKSAIQNGTVLLRSSEAWESSDMSLKAAEPDEVLAWTVGEGR